jgi:hypothetical protein
MESTPIRSAFPSWPGQARALRDTVARFTDEQLALRPSPERWPIWATIGHLACQRVFWLCDFAGEPGVEQTPFPDSGNVCPGDEDLEHVLGPAQLVAALDATFAIVEQCLDGWTADTLNEVISHPEWGEGRSQTRGFIINRVYAHDVSHITELNEALTGALLPIVDLWGA